MFDRFSWQYLGLILIIANFFLFSLKEIKLILKISRLGIISIIVFILYMLVEGVINIAEGNVSLTGSAPNLKLFTGDVATLAGVYALSFFIHSLIIPILKNNSD